MKEIRELFEARCNLESTAADAWSEGFLAAALLATSSASSLFKSKRDAVETLFPDLAEDGEVGAEFVERILAMLGTGQPEAEAAEDADLSQRGREAAAKCLERKGYKMLEKGRGPIDIISLDPRGTVVFTTVVTYRGKPGGMPSDILGASTRRALEATAIEYMADGQWEDGTPLRFDAITICVNGTNKAILRHHMGIIDGTC